MKVLCLDIGITTGIAVFDVCRHPEGVRLVFVSSWTPEQLHELFSREAERSSYIFVEFPLEYPGLLGKKMAELSDVVKTSKIVIRVTPGEWKNSRWNCKTPSTWKMSSPHEKDAVLLGLYGIDRYIFTGELLWDNVM